VLHDLLAHPHTPLAGRGLLLIVGLALLVAGRKLFWLGVGALGFVVGWDLAPTVAPHLPPAGVLLVAVVLAVLGAVLAIVMQKVAVALAGFLLGVVLASRLLPMLALHAGQWQGLLVAAIGIVCAFLALALFGLALTVLTAGAGASMLVDAFRPPPALALLALVALWIAGIVVQRRWKT
jgi:hypothetical protein